MPITDVTTPKGGEIISARDIFPCYGKLFKGAKKNDKGHVGPDLDYFRVEFEKGFEYLRPAFKNAYGLKPKVFDRVILTSPDVHEAFDSWYIEFAGETGIMRYRCDGETISSWYDMDNSCVVDEPKPCMKNDPQTPCNCSMSGRLFVMLPDLSLGGYFTLRTGSVRDLANIYKSLAGVQALGGNIMKMYWTLKRVPKENIDHVPIKDRQTGEVTTKRVKKIRAEIRLEGHEDALSRLIMENLEASGHELLASPPDLKQLPESVIYTDEVMTGEIVDDDSHALPPGDDPDLIFPQELIDALASLTGMEYKKLLAGLYKRVDSGDITDDDTLIDIFQKGWGWIQEAWIGETPNIANWLLDDERQPMQPLQIYACVNDLTGQFDDRGKTTKNQTAKLLDELMSIVGYKKRTEGAAAMDTLSAFLFAGKKADTLTKKQARAIHGWWAYQNEAGEYQYFTTALEEIGLILACDTHVQALYAPSGE